MGITGPMSESAALYAERYQKLYRCGKEYGVIVAQENISALQIR